MSKFLAIDTSSKYLTVLAVNGEKKVLRHLDDCALKHSVILAGEIDAALKQAELNPADCDFFAAVTGPGSFTGIRIGIATVKGFALALSKPLLGVTSFDLIAYNVADENFFVVIDALRGNYYVRGYKKADMPPRYMSGEEVAALNAPLYGFEELPLEGYTRVEVKNCLYPAVTASKNCLSQDIYALYVRKSQAEEAADAAKKMGI